MPRAFPRTAIRASGLSAFAVAVALRFAPLALASCVLEFNTEPRDAPATEVEIWERDFNLLARDVREEFVFFAESDYSLTVGSAGSRIVWQGADGRLHGDDDHSPTSRIDYTFDLDPSIYPSFWLGTESIVTVSSSDDGEAWVLSAYALDAPSSLVDSIRWPAAASIEESSPPVAVDGALVYLLDPQGTLHRWYPAQGEPEPVVDLAERGLAADASSRFQVRGEELLLLQRDATADSDSGGYFSLWRLELGSGAAQRVAEDVFEFCFHPGGFAYAMLPPDAAMPGFFSQLSADGSAVDLGAVLADTELDLGRGRAVSFERLIDAFFGDEDEDPGFAEDDIGIGVIDILTCDSRGVTFENLLGAFSFEVESGGLQVLTLHPISEDSDDGDYFFFLDSTLVGDAVFALLEVCESGGEGRCASAIHRRDL